MRKPEFYYIALEYGKKFKTLSDLEISKIKINDTYVYYTCYGIHRGNHYQIVFTHNDKVVTLSFVYNNFKSPRCSFCISYHVSYLDIVKDFLDFKTFCLTISHMMDGFFYNKNFQCYSSFI